MFGYNDHENLGTAYYEMAKAKQEALELQNRSLGGIPCSLEVYHGERVSLVKLIKKIFKKTQEKTMCENSKSFTTKPITPL